MARPLHAASRPKSLSRRRYCRVRLAGGRPRTPHAHGPAPLGCWLRRQLTLACIDSHRQPRAGAARTAGRRSGTKVTCNGRPTRREQLSSRTVITRGDVPPTFAQLLRVLLRQGGKGFPDEDMIRIEVVEEDATCEHCFARTCALQPCSCRCPESTGPLTATGLHALRAAGGCTSRMMCTVHPVHPSRLSLGPAGAEHRDTAPTFVAPPPFANRGNVCTYSTPSYIHTYVLFFLAVIFYFRQGQGICQLSEAS